MTRAGGLALPERGLGGTGAAARAESIDLAEGSRRGLAHVTPARRRVAGFGGRGGEKGLGWGGEPCVSRYRAFSRMKGGGGEGDHFVLAPPCLRLGCHGGGKGEERGLLIAAAGLGAGRTCCISHACLPFIHPFRAVRTPQRMRVGLGPVLSCFYCPEHF